jgi:hypothetical protein
MRRAGAFRDDNVGVAVEWNTAPEVIEQLRGYLAASDHRKDGYAVGM